MTDNPYGSPHSSDDRPSAEHPTKGAAKALVLVGAGVVIVIFLFLMLLPGMRGSPGAMRRSACFMNLKQIGSALHMYHDAHGEFPPAYTVDANGKPLHSWRTLILPFMEQQALYDTIDLAKPWDDPTNKTAFETPVPVYRCPGADIPPTHTTYLAVAAPGGLFEPGKAKKFDDIKDDSPNTLAVVEVSHHHAVHWMSPHDADEAMILQLARGDDESHTSVANVLFGDGAVRGITDETPDDQRRAMISIAGGDDAIAKKFFE